MEALLKTSNKPGQVVSSAGPGSKFRISTVHRHLFATTASSVTIWNLPEELLVYLLRGLHITDLLSMRSVHPAFRDIIDGNCILWNSASFADTWPSVHNIKHFERAAKFRNIESLLKLAIAYLYNEGLPHDEEGQRMRTNGMHAAAMFCDVEALTPDVTPFTWLFIRPPWSAGRACCKECVFKNMLVHVKRHQDANVALCVSQILRLFEDADAQRRMLSYLTLSAQGGNHSAMYMLWCEKYNNKSFDKAMELQSARELRDIASLGELEAQLALCRYYATTQHSPSQFVQYCGVSRESAVATVRAFFQSSTPSSTRLIFTYHPDISYTMRYILIDWIVEVASNRVFSTHTLHVAVSVVDRFLRAHKMSRNKLQLLGVAAMVLCSRFLGKDIITIREAAWLTDNTYRYEDVVRMMGEVVATLRGKLRVVTSLDYLFILEDIARVDSTTKYLAEYALEMSLLHAELSRYKRAEIAASCLLFARLMLKKHYPWSSQLEEFTGFTISSLTKCVIHLFSKCFVSGRVTDHRNIELEAVKQRYSTENFCSASQIEFLSVEELCSLLGLSEYVFVDDDIQVRFKQPSDMNSCTSCSHRPAYKPADSSGTSTPVTSGLTSSSGHPSSSNTDTDDECSMSSTDDSGPSTARVTPDMHIYRRSSGDCITPLSVENTPLLHSDLSSENPIPSDVRHDVRMTSDVRPTTTATGVRTPKKRSVRLHDRSGRHNIPSQPISLPEPMQESPVKLEPVVGSPMKTE